MAKMDDVSTLLLQVDALLPNFAHEQDERIVPAIEVPRMRFSIARVLAVEPADYLNGL